MTQINRQRRSRQRVRKPGTGRPSIYDSTPSPEAMAKRRQLAGAGDPNKTSTLLDLLETKCLISPAQSEAGRHFGWLRRKIYGRTHVPALDPNVVRGRTGGSDAANWERLEADYRRLCAGLIAAGHDVRQVTEDICAFNRCTALAGASGSGAKTILSLLKQGLDAIDRARTPDQSMVRNRNRNGDAG